MTPVNISELERLIESYAKEDIKCSDLRDQLLQLQKEEAWLNHLKIDDVQKEQALKSLYALLQCVKERMIHPAACTFPNLLDAAHHFNRGSFSKNGLSIRIGGIEYTQPEFVQSIVALDPLLTSEVVNNFYKSCLGSVRDVVRQYARLDFKHYVGLIQEKYGSTSKVYQSFLFILNLCQEHLDGWDDYPEVTEYDSYYGLSWNGSSFSFCSLTCSIDFNGKIEWGVNIESESGISSLLNRVINGY